jgi:asparagine N-glycosylation enzyme membrane subunit Stt3
MRRSFVALATLLMLMIVGQFFLAAMGAFDPGAKEEAFAPHRVLGYVILLFAVVLTVLAAVARLPGRLIGLTGLVGGLVLLQAVIASVANALGDPGVTSSSAGKLVFGLHAINALIIFGVAEEVRRRTRELTRRLTETATGSDSDLPTGQPTR